MPRVTAGHVERAWPSAYNADILVGGMIRVGDGVAEL